MFDLIELEKSSKFKDYVKGFRWQTMKGEILTIDQMDTKHCFNSMKMLYNHLAGAEGKPTVCFNHVYTVYTQLSFSKNDDIKYKKMVLPILVFICEIERRGDLPVRYQANYSMILSNLTGEKYVPLMKAEESKIKYGIQKR